MAFLFFTFTFLLRFTPVSNLCRGAVAQSVERPPKGPRDGATLLTWVQILAVA